MCSPTTTVVKKLPNRTIAKDRRAILGCRGINLFTPKTDYFAPATVSIDEVVEECFRVNRAFPTSDVSVTKRDIASAFKLRRIHPDSARLFGTEFHGWGFEIGFDVVAFYLCLPFGWSGSPGEFASIARAIPKWHRSHAPSDPSWNSCHNFSSFLFVDDGIPVGPSLGNREEQSTSCLEEGANLTFGIDAVSGGDSERRVYGKRRK